MFGQGPLEALDRLIAFSDAGETGFIVEGAAMGASLRDAVSIRSGLLVALYDRHAARFEYLIAVGAGWAIARMPWRAKRIVAIFEPCLGPLAYDGSGFHDLYFHSSKGEIGQISRYSGSRARAYDAGLGRALWFVASGQVPHLNNLIKNFHPHRKRDLLSGIGLAMAYAGPATAEDWQALRIVHEGDWLHVGQGICFASEAMRRAGTMPKHTELACQAALGLSSEQAAAIASTTRPTCVGRSGGDAAYEAWRAEICRRLS